MPGWLTDYDIHLRHAAVRGGAWVGFRLAWAELAGKKGLEGRPHLRYRPWVLDPAYPHQPSKGSWGEWQWEVWIACLPGMVGLTGRLPADGRTHWEMVVDLRAFAGLPVMELQDADGSVYSVIMSGYEERAVEAYDARHPQGGWLVFLEFVLTS
jgi:hypothetical protein